MKRPVLWLVDGHNLIFQFRELEELQVSGKKGEARRALEAVLKDFALHRNERVHIVYDGNALDRNPDAIHEDLFATIYTGQQEEADDRIVYLARTHSEKNERVHVVTSDVRTLANDLPKDVDHITAGDFRRRHLTKRRKGKRAAQGDFSDLEAEFLRVDAETPCPPPRQAPTPGVVAPAPRPGPEPAGRQKPAAQASGLDEAARERIRLKKEKGLRRQQRRLQRRGKSNH